MDAGPPLQLVRMVGVDAMTRAVVALLIAGAGVALSACGSEAPLSTATVQGPDNVHILVVDKAPPDGSDDLVLVAPTVDRDTGCLVDEHGDPLAFPKGTRISGTPDDWTITTPGGEEIRAGETLQGGAEDNQSMDWVADPPTQCGPPPWHVFHENLARSSGPG